MRLFLDNDVIIKLSNYNLLLSFLHLTAENGYHLKYLDALPFFCFHNKPDRMRERFNREESWNESIQFVQSDYTSPIADLSEDMISRVAMLSTSSLDPGELILTISAEADGNGGFVSGDKRALVALSDKAGNGALSTDSFFVVSFEQCIKIIICNIDPHDVLTKIIKNPSVDNSILAILGHAKTDELTNILDGLDSYIRHLKQNASSLNFFNCSPCNKRINSL